MLYIMFNVAILWFGAFVLGVGGYRYFNLFSMNVFPFIMGGLILYLLIRCAKCFFKIVSGKGDVDYGKVILALPVLCILGVIFIASVS